jgi:hypothetical protein
MIVVRGLVRSVIAATGGQPTKFGIEFENLGFHNRREIRNFVAAATRSDSYMGL